MSNYRQAAYDPESQTVRTAWWMDDWFGKHQYGVRFDDGGKVYKPAEVEIPLDVVFVPKGDSELPRSAARILPLKSSPPPSEND